jgi:hypothetical protein
LVLVALNWLMEQILLLLGVLRLVVAMALVVFLMLAQEMVAMVAVAVGVVYIVQLQLVEQQPKQVITVVQGMDLLVALVMYHPLTILLVVEVLLL